MEKEEKEKEFDKHALNIVKKEFWKFYPYRMMVVNWYVLFVVVLLIFAKIYQLQFHLALILFTPLIIKFVFNAILYGKFFIQQLKIVDNMIEIKYYKFGLYKSKIYLLDEIEVIKSRSNTLKPRYHIVLKFSDNIVIKQYDFFGWSNKDFDELVGIR